MEDRPMIGIGVIIIKGNKVLVGKRKGPHGKGTWSFPGGHLEFNEELKDCAKMEVLEETGIHIKNIRKAPYTNDIHKKEGKHYVTLFLVADYAYGKPKVMEPDRCEKWGWFEWKKLPRPLFLPNKNLLKQKFNPFR
jgi:8-oxo-dGTP diphosphatase